MSLPTRRADGHCCRFFTARLPTTGRRSPGASLRPAGSVCSTARMRHRAAISARCASYGGEPAASCAAYVYLSSPSVASWV